MNPGEPSMKLSVIIVARNEERNIARCIESVLKQTEKISDVEILLADSASMDKTVDIANGYPINIISLKPDWPLSPSAGRFSGVNNVSGEYILIIDGDMELLNDWVEKALNFMESRPQVASVVGRLYDIWKINDQVHRNCNGEISRGTAIKKISFVFGSSLFRREHLIKSGNFQPFLRAEEEAEISYRLIRNGYELYFLPEDAVNHYTMPRNTFNETIRRFHKNLWSGMGDMFNWCLYKGYFGIVWKRFYVFILFSALVSFILIGFILTIVTKNNLWAIDGSFLCFVYVSYMCFKKRNIYQGLLSVLNIALITYNLWAGLGRRIPLQKEYPLDVIWIKRKKIT